MDHETLPNKSAGYDSSIEALYDVLNSCHITEIFTSLSHLANGIVYSFVEVTCIDGIQYGLQAYGNEALKLNRIALENIPKEQQLGQELAPMVF
ncbi:MAG: hypothetical protein ACRD8Z_21790 [Nitrososphaeraceae archaeon]